MTTHSRAFWQRLVGEVTAGQRAAEVARRYRVPASTLRVWKSRLEREKSTGGPALLPVVVRPTVRHEGAEGGLLELSFGRLTLRFESGTDTAYVAELVGRLSGSC